VRPAASTPDCSLVSGKAQSFNLFRQAPPFHATVRSQGFCDRQCVGRGRVLNWPHAPKRAAAVVFEGATVKTAYLLWFWRLAGHDALFLARADGTPQRSRFGPPDPGSVYHNIVLKYRRATGVSAKGKRVVRALAARQQRALARGGYRPKVQEWLG